MSKFKGLGVALVTPFLDNGGVDMAGLQRLVEHNVENGTDYLVVQGTTGESVTLTKEEKKAVLDFVIEINNGRKPIVLGVGGNNTAEIVKALSEMDTTGIDGILSVSPYYNKPTQEGIFQHYKALNAATKLPIILYNVPGRTSSNVTAATTVRIAKECKNIVAVKEASGNLEQIMHIINNRPKGFLVLSGDDALTLPHIAAGGDGVISVIGNAFPKRFSRMVHAALEGDLVQARKDHYDLFEMIPLLFAEGNPAGIKRVLATKGICKENVRLPLVTVSKELAAKLDDMTKMLA
ncbi:MAG: 4-hydroxy-tetrahydrodipicolinate synthase [Flavobacteriales bacterium]|nr:4-hydroxy-tetrahydrodipicolinate synthase [Flavobacteriales bacterium]